MNCIFEPIWFHLKALKKIVLGEKKVEEKNFNKKYKFLYNSRIFFCSASETLSIFITAVFGLFAVNFLKPLILTFSGRILFVMLQ